VKELDFEPAEYRERQSRVRAAMEAHGVDLLLVISPQSLHWLIGFRAKSYQEFQCLLFPLEEASLVMLTRLAEVGELRDLTLADEVVGWGGREPEDPIEALERLLRQKGHGARRIGVEAPDYYLGPHDWDALRGMLGDRLALDATRLIPELKMVKSPAELALMRRAAAIADAAMQTCVETLAEGRTELELAAGVIHTLLARGSDQPASPMNFVTGERTCYGHGAPTERVIRRGDFMHIEFGASYHRYTATLGRQLCLGEPAARMRELYDVVRAACDACIAEMKPGVAAIAPHLAAKKVIADAGLDEHRTHTTGYGLAPGFPPAWIEPIEMFGDCEQPLRAGMVLSVEPPVLVHRERIGARIIDNVLVGDDGPTLMSTFRRDLIVL